MLKSVKAYSIRVLGTKFLIVSHRSSTFFHFYEVRLANKKPKVPLILGLTSLLGSGYCGKCREQTEATKMLNATPNTNTQFIRNYAIAAATVMLMSMGVTDIFYSPNRVAQQDRLNGYAPYIGAGLVSYGKSLAR